MRAYTGTETHTHSVQQKTHLAAQRVQGWDHDYGIHWFYHASHHPEAAGLAGMREGEPKVKVSLKL